MSQSARSHDGSTGLMDDRTERSINEEISLTGEIEPIQFGGDLKYVVVEVENGDSTTGENHAPKVYPDGWVDGTCKDARFNDPDDGCKHARYVRALLQFSRALNTKDDAVTNILRETADFSEQEIDTALRVLRLIDGE